MLCVVVLFAAALMGSIQSAFAEGTKEQGADFGVAAGGGMSKRGSPPSGPSCV